jgi:hypothetical protein
MDGKPATFTSESKKDIWVISCVYSQSEHTFSVQLPSAEIVNAAAIPWTPIIIIVVIAVVIVLVAIALVVKRKRRTAAIVESILKEDRPVH